MTKLNSEQLKAIQDIIKERVIEELNRPNTDFDKMHKMTKLIEAIDDARRIAWNDEKFGVYGRMADEILERALGNKYEGANDDIPF